MANETITTSADIFTINVTETNTFQPSEDFLTTKTTPTGSQAAQNMLDLFNTITNYLYPVIFICGIVGNILAILVFTRREMRKIPTSVCYIFVGFADLGVLFIGPLTYWIRDALGFNLWTINSILCKVMTYFMFLTSVCAVWTLIVVTIQRLQIVVFPISSRVSVSTRRVFITLLAVYAALVLIYIPTATETFIYEAPNLGKRCRVDWNLKFWQIFSWVDSFLRLFLPLVIQIILNTVIIYKLYRASQERKKLNCTLDDKKKESYKMLKMVLGVNLVFIVSYLPFTVFVFYTQVNPNLKFMTSVAYIIFFEVGLIMLYMSHASNFYIYILSGQKFRQVFKGMFVKA